MNEFLVYVKKEIKEKGVIDDTLFWYIDDRINEIVSDRLSQCMEDLLQQVRDEQRV